MSNRMLRIDPPTIDETTENMDNLKLEAGSEWDTMSNLGPPSEGRRGSTQLSVVSGESRRQSLFGDEDLDEDKSEASQEDEGEEERRRKREEVFIDKTRAAMVVIGTKDIKDALERQKAVEISRKTPEAKVAHVLFHQAKFLTAQSRFKEALLFINRALNVEAENKEWVTEKSRCYLNLLEPETALKFVDQVLQKDPNYFKAIVLKGEILYSMWDLEKAMLFFVEGRRMRPDNTDCIKGAHKVRMALEDIADSRVSSDEHKNKSLKNRSKSAKGRFATSSTECLLGRNKETSAIRYQFSGLSSFLDGRTTPPVSGEESPSTTTVLTCRKMESASFEMKPSTARPLSTKGKGVLNRPKTAMHRRSRSKSTSRDLEIEDIRRFVKESMSGSYKSSTLRRFSGSTQSSGRNDFSSQSFSSSMEHVPRVNGSKKSEIAKLSRVNICNEEPNQRSRITPGTKVSVFLGQDKMFLDSLLKDKDLKRSQTAYTRRALKLAKEVQNFVSEREKYWKNRENFVRYTTTDEDTLI